MRGGWAIGLVLALGLARADSSVPVLVPLPSPAPVPDGRDRDRDGVPDAVDKCPDAKEDRDGFEDEDGCPDPDNDGDGIPDASDRCPYEHELSNGPGHEGCPDLRTPRWTTAHNKEVPDLIHFRHNSSEIPKEAHFVLDAIAAFLKGNPQLTLEILGHRGANERRGVAQGRIESVRNYLLNRDVAADRLYFNSDGARRRELFRLPQNAPSDPQSVGFVTITHFLRFAPSGTLQAPGHVQ